MAASAWPQWLYNTASSGTTYTMAAPLAVYSGGAGGGAALPAPRPQTALEWLDDEIEATCRLARQGA